MQALKTNFTDRLEAQAAAKQALLAKFKPKPTIRAVEPVDRDAERRAEVERIRAELGDAKKAEEQARMMAKAAEVQAKIEAETSEDEIKRAERKERKAAMKTAAREKRELKSMMRR